MFIIKSILASILDLGGTFYLITALGDGFKKDDRAIQSWGSKHPILYGIVRIWVVLWYLVAIMVLTKGALERLLGRINEVLMGIKDLLSDAASDDDDDIDPLDTDNCMTDAAKSVVRAKALQAESEEEFISAARTCLGNGIVLEDAYLKGVWAAVNSDIGDLEDIPTTKWDDPLT